MIAMAHAILRHCYAIQIPVPIAGTPASVGGPNLAEAILPVRQSGDKDTRKSQTVSSMNIPAMPVLVYQEV